MGDSAMIDDRRTIEIEIASPITIHGIITTDGAVAEGCSYSSYELSAAINSAAVRTRPLSLVFRGGGVVDGEGSI